MIRVQCRDFMERSGKINSLDAALVGLFALVLFGFAGFSGRPLTMHEARLPETSREMLANHEWLLPHQRRPAVARATAAAALVCDRRDETVWAR